MASKGHGIKTPPKTPSKKRRHSTSSSDSVSKRAARRVSQKSMKKKVRLVDKGDATNVVATYSRKKGKSVAKEGVPRKKVKVSKDFRKKVDKVLEKEAGNGWFKEIYYRDAKITPVDNDQVVFNPTSGMVTASLADGCQFDPCAVLNAASILFNGKVPTIPSKAFNDVGNFSAETLRVNVEDSSVVYRFLNNTARTMTIKLWDCSPKSAIINTAQPSFPAPINQWTQGLAQQVPDTLETGLNPLSNLISTLTNRPQTLTSFMKLFSVDETIITLEAGKEYNHRLQGPKSKLYDFSKFYQNGVIGNFQKMNKFTFGAVYLNLTGITPGTSGEFGRWTDMTTAGANGLLVETTSFYRLTMPEQAGLKVPPLPVAGQPLPLNSRKSGVFAIQNWANPQTATSVVGPVQDETPDAVAPVGPV